MAIFILIASLFIGPAVADRENDRGDDEDKEKTSSATRRTPDYAVQRVASKSGTVWLNLQYGVVDSYFDGDGDSRDLGAFTLPQGIELDTDAEITTTVLHLGGSYTVHRIGDLDLDLGADLGVANQTLNTQAVEQVQPATELSSGFTPQNLALFGELNAPQYALRVGYLFDLGPEPNGAEEERENSDRQDALLLGVSGQYQQPSFRLFGGFDYFLTFEGEETATLPTGSEVEVSYDQGDVYKLHGGAGLRFAQNFELGAALIYRVKSEGVLDETQGGDIDPAAFAGAPNPYGDSQVLSIAPYLSYTAVDSPLQLYVKGAVQREYYDYGYALAGDNDIAPQLGVTAGVVVGI